MDIIPTYMSFVSKLAGHIGQKSGLIGHWPIDIHSLSDRLIKYLVLIGSRIPKDFGYDRTAEHDSSIVAKVNSKRIDG